MFRIIKWTMRIIFVLLLVGSLALNVGILFVGGVATIASNVAESVIEYSPIKSVRGTKTVYSKTNANINKTTGRIFRRAAVGATRDITGLAVQSVPYLGIGALVIAAGWDIKDSCDTINDLQELKKGLGLPLEDEAEATRVCGLKPPSAEEITQSIKNAPSAIIEKAKELFNRDPPSPEK